MEIQYIAIDKSKFSNKKECIDYEKTLLSKPEVLPKEEIDIDEIIKYVESIVKMYIEGDEDWDEYLSKTMVTYIYGNDGWNKLMKFGKY